MIAGRIRRRTLIDRTILEIFGNGGRLYMSMGIFSPPDNTSLALYARGSSARVDALEVFEMQSIW
jgi:sucrose-6-phosphate hydrolase SacC (GH32 family)